MQLALNRQPVKKELTFFAVFFFFLIVAFILPPLSQPESYHAFADTRAIFGIPRAMDVLTNIAFFLAALYGLRATSAKKHHFSPAFLWSMEIFFWGVMLTAFGSAYYHYAPDSARLVWDRLPMTIAFSGICGALASCRVSQRAGFITLLLCTVGGLGTVLCWQITGNLTPYVTMQFGGLVWVACAFMFGQVNPKEDLPWGLLLLCYGLAKAAEHFDVQIFEALQHVASGHSIKHVLAAMAAVAFAVHIRKKADGVKTFAV